PTRRSSDLRRRSFHTERATPPRTADRSRYRHTWIRDLAPDPAQRSATRSAIDRPCTQWSPPAALSPRTGASSFPNPRSRSLRRHAVEERGKHAPLADTERLPAFRNP